MATDSNVLVVGAGPYGLTAAVQLRRAGVDADVFGRPMSFWRVMPKGMLLRSNWGASSMIEHGGPLSLDAYIAATGDSVGEPVPLEAFVRYGEWVQETAVPDVDSRSVDRVEREGSRFVVTLSGGDTVTAARVIVACGIAAFAHRPAVFAELPEHAVSHTSEHPDLGVFAGRSVAVVGSGQSALESAALLRETGASVEVLARAGEVVWLRGHSVKRRLKSLGPVVYAPTDVGPLWYSRLVAQPGLFRHLPRESQDRIARRCIRPAGSHWLRERLAGVGFSFGVNVRAARPAGDRVELTLDDGSRRTVDHVLLGTGFKVDVRRYGILGDSSRRPA